MKSFVVFAHLITTAAAFAAFKPLSRTNYASSSSALSMAMTNGATKKKVIVLGGDGFCGWPTSLYLSDQGHDVVVVDNLSRRNIDTELGCDSLTPIQPMEVGT